jgi:ABC transporter substrate binding protein (PQQ-dependent alcohol dehydrogenase system)
MARQGIITTVAGAALLALLATAGPAEAKVKLPAASTGAAGPVQTVTIGYLGLTNDPRYQPFYADAEIELAPADDPVLGVKLGLADEKIVTDAVGLSVSLDPETSADIASLTAKLKTMAGQGERFVIVDLPDDLTGELAEAAKDIKVTLINISAHGNALREACYKDLLDTAASDRQASDALVQLLVSHSWSKVLVLVGPTDRDKALAKSFADSANRLRLNIVDTREFSLSLSPTERDKNDTLLVTGNADYDVVYVADTGQQFGRYLPYRTQLARPVIGSAGLMANEWHWAWDRYGAPQVQHRFEKLSDGRHMTDADWAGWMAAKTLMDAYSRTGAADPEVVDKYLRSDNLRSDGSKGVSLSYRPWSGQLREPILLATDNAVIADAPLGGFEHQLNNLDTLGQDEPESKCR